jgi:hypothetical protein
MAPDGQKLRGVYSYVQKRDHWLTRERERLAFVACEFVRRPKRLSGKILSEIEV